MDLFVQMMSMPLVEDTGTVLYWYFPLLLRALNQKTWLVLLTSLSSWIQDVAGSALHWSILLMHHLGPEHAESEEISLPGMGLSILEIE